MKIVYNATSDTNLEFYFHLIIKYNIKDRYHQKTLFILVIKHNIKDRYHQKTFKFILVRQVIVKPTHAFLHLEIDFTSICYDLK